MRECEFLSIDKYKTNIENYNTQLKYECGVFLVLFFYSCFVFFWDGSLALFIIITAFVTVILPVRRWESSRIHYEYIMFITVFSFF